MPNLHLITGGTGFLGQALTRTLLAEGEAVRVLTRDPHSPAAQRLAILGADIAIGDVTNADAVRAAAHEATHVFHLAGPLLVPGVPERVYTETHIEGTRHVLAACVGQPRLQAIVHCSTTGVLGITGPTPQSEGAPYHPSNIYERSKMHGEKLALALAREHALPLSVARPALVYGPGDVHLLGWFRAIQRGYYAIIGRGENLLHPIYIDDVVEGLRRCANTPAAVGRVYHLVGERPVPIGELANAIAEALGRGPLWHMPLGLAQFAATVFEALPIDRARLPLTQQRLDFMMQSRAYRGDCARAELGFAPRTDLASGLQHTVAWYRAEGLLQ